MSILSEKERQRIIEILKSGEDLPLDYKHIIFPPEKKEYELVYAGKEREEDILADTMAVPLQPIKTFGKNGDDWTNKLIFGDNLQVMKSLLDDPDVKGQVKLIYIDPPFATKQEFRGSQDQKAYQDKIAGSQFVEFLRKRLIFLRELLADDGSIYVHLDWKKAHYLKTIMDEIFGENFFRNEIIWHYRTGNISDKQFQRKHDVIFLYSKTEHMFFKPLEIKEYYFCIYGPGFKPSFKGRKSGKDKYGEYRISFIDDVWDISAVFTLSGEHTEYPTQKPEKLIERVIEASSQNNNLILDAFAGSGTTLAVAEKLGRRWIGIDCGKLAIYTMQKRMLNLKSEIGKKGKKLKHKPFTLYHAGRYDFPKLKKLPWKDWRLFALHLFNCRDSKHTVSGIELDGYKGRSDVLVFNYQQDGGVVLDYGFIDDLHAMLGSKVGKQFFIIAPAASVMFLEDYIEKGSVRYYILRIPYSIINELHNRDFEAIKQPIDESQVNDTVDAVGFDFIRTPKVKCKYSIEKQKNQLFEYATIKIITFKSEAMLKGASQLANRESFSMIMVDFNYDGDIFNLDKVYYASEIEKNGWKVFLPLGEIKGQMMIIYLDIYGNEYREIKRIEDFSNSKQINAEGN
ncbi:site-specific DNA-methyltransferase [bacterium]|nr:MAG: site-specific DNA-methyltransferase [bacterium]